MSVGDDWTPARSPTDDIIEVYKKDVDRGLLRENLRLTVDQRVRKMISALRFAEAVRQSRRVPDPR
jgi:hypothetical protein